MPEAMIVLFGATILWFEWVPGWLQVLGGWLVASVLVSLSVVQFF